MPKVNINDAEFYYELHGQGQPLVLISGFCGDHQNWLGLLGALTAHFQVLIFDNRGVGQTKDDGRALNVDLMADDVMALCKALNLNKPHIVGHSMGGTIAQNIAVRYPQAISKLGIVTSAAKWRQAMLQGEKTLLMARQENVSFDMLFTMVLSWVAGERFLQNPENIAFMKHFFANHPSPQSVEDMTRQYQVLVDFDGRAHLKDIKAPTLVVYGHEDIITLPDESEAMATGIPNAKLLGLPCAHIPNIEVPEEFSQALIRFFA